MRKMIYTLSDNFQEAPFMAKNKKKRKKLKIFLTVLLVIILGTVLIVVPPMLVKTIDNSWSFASKSDNPPLIVAHRGLSSLAPQNSVPAFEKAVEYGFDGYEFDIHTTKDGEWVVIHDDTVDAMTDGEGLVADMTLEEIKQLKLDAGNGIEEYTDLRVPTLDEALTVCKDSDIFPVIEIKSCDTEKLPDLIETLERYGLTEKAVLIAFNSEYLEICRELDNDIQMLLLAVSVEKENIDWCIEHKAGINFCYGYLFKSTSALKYARENSVKIGVWTVDNTVFEDIMVLNGAEIITTNKLLP